MHGSQLLQDTYMDHFRYGTCMQEHCRIDIDCQGVEKVGVQILIAHKTSASYAGVLRQIPGCNGDGKGEWEDPAKASEPSVVAVDNVTPPDCKLHHFNAR